MGYYFPKARSLKDLDLQQQERYKILRSTGRNQQPALLSRIETVEKHAGPITSGEIWSALEELLQDVFVTWILAGEDPEKVQWVDPEDLTEPTPPPTEEEKLKTREWLESLSKRPGYRIPQPKVTLWGLLRSFIHRSS